MVEEVVMDYASYANVDLGSELHDVQDTIDDMLTRLDEFENLVNMVKADNELSSDISIPIVLQSKQKLDVLCKQVDSLEKFICQVKCDMKVLESHVEEAEEEISQPNGRLKNMLKPFLKLSSGNDPVQRQSHTASYKAPILFRTSSFFPSQNEGAVQNVQKL